MTSSNRWMDRWTDGRMAGQTDTQTHRHTDTQKHRQTWIDGCMGAVQAWMDRWMDGWMNASVYPCMRWTVGQAGQACDHRCRARGQPVHPVSRRAHKWPRLEGGIRCHQSCAEHRQHGCLCDLHHPPAVAGNSYRLLRRISKYILVLGIDNLSILGSRTEMAFPGND